MASRIIRETPTILALLSRGQAQERLDEKLAEAFLTLPNPLSRSRERAGVRA